MRVLISGASVAGLTLAYWLKAHGMTPTLVEKAPALRTGGYKIDIRGTALDVVRRMGLYEQIRAAGTDIQRASMVDREGNEILQMEGDAYGLRVGDDLEIGRGALCQILMGQLDEVEARFGDSIRLISETDEGVWVEFESGTQRTFDLVIGADGLHSTVRRLVFGDEALFAKQLGLTLCVFSVPNWLGLDRREVEYLELGRFVQIWSARGDRNATAAFAYVTPPGEPELSDVAQQKQQMRSVFGDMNWEVPRLLHEMDAATDFYFDAVTQICMESWSKGRIALVGDAGYCPSPMSGQGTSVALIGAYVLAGELASHRYEEAFTQYNSLLRPFILRNQALAIHAAKLMRSKASGGLAGWLAEKALSLLPARWIQWFTHRACRRIHRVANSISLKDYTATREL
jgi:2-polyprenyl-6-methoxyphenol hydroxylase-like FAD-dependent oxidoreductase